jgi:hypothetical protein
MVTVLPRPSRLCFLEHLRRPDLRSRLRSSCGMLRCSSGPPRVTGTSRTPIDLGKYRSCPACSHLTTHNSEVAGSRNAVQCEPREGPESLIPGLFALLAFAGLAGVAGSALAPRTPPVGVSFRPCAGLSSVRRL